MTTDQRNALIDIIRQHKWSTVEDALKGLGKPRFGEEKTRQVTRQKSAKRARIEAKLRNVIEGAGLAQWPLDENVDKETMMDAIETVIDNASNKLNAMRVGNKVLAAIMVLNEMGVSEAEMRAAHFGQQEYTETETYRERLPSLWAEVCGDEDELEENRVRWLMREAG
jgi:hypothetical protein